MKINFDEKHKTYYVQFRYKNYAGKSVSTTRRGFPTKRAAKDEAIRIQLQAAGLPTVTVREMVEEMMASLKERLRPNSIRQKEMLYRIYICKKLGDMQIAKITPRVIRQWQDDLPKDKSPSTIAAINGAFSSLFTYAVKYYDLPGNPFKVTGKTGRPEKRDEFWEDEQFQVFISQVDKPLWHCVFNLVYYCGLRRGEVPPITIQDLDVEAETISINKSLDDEGRIGPPKHNSNRVISLPKFLIDEILAYRQTLPEPPDRIFLISYAAMKVNFTKYLKRSGLPHITLHGLRHSHASHLIQLGVPITTISHRLGHANAAITLRVYSHVYQKSDKDVAKILQDTQNSAACRQIVVTEKEKPSQPL